VPLSDDPAKRSRQLANLRPGAGAGDGGHGRALKHGGTARRATLVRAGTWAAAIQAELEREAPLRDASGGLPLHDRQVVELLASALARLEAVTTWLDLRPALDPQGRPWPAEEIARSLRLEAARYLDALGMSPGSRAKLGLDLQRTTSLAVAMSEPDADRRRVLLAEAGIDVDDDGDGADA